MIKYIAPPLIGALIGYFTNYIAVKMLFRPRETKYIFGHRVPFTPGAIPKGKPRLAKAIGDVIANYLVTDDDIKNRVLTPAAEDAVVEKTMHILKTKIDDGFHKAADSEEEYDQLIFKIEELATDKIASSINDIDFTTIIRQKGGQLIGEQINSTMLAMFVTPELIDGILSGVSENINTYINNHSRKFIAPEVSRNFEGLRQESVLSLLQKAEIDEETVKDKIREIYVNIMNESISRLIASIDIAGMVRSKIDDMEAAELEALVMQVMKNELNTIVNLGALIGFLLGLINLLF